MTNPEAMILLVISLFQRLTSSMNGAGNSENVIVPVVHTSATEIAETRRRLSVVGRIQEMPVCHRRRFEHLLATSISA
jgi:hypothetical protein